MPPGEIWQIHYLDAVPVKNQRRLPRVPGWPPAKGSRLLINVVTVAITVVFAYIALSDITLGQMWHALRTSDYWWLPPAVIPCALATPPRPLRWRWLSPPGRPPPATTTMN